MSVSASTWQSLILKEVGAGLDGNDSVEREALDFVIPMISVFWEAWAAKAFYPHLRYLYTKRQAIDTLLGQLRTKNDKSLGTLSQSLSQRVAHLQKMRDFVTADIQQNEKTASANRSGSLKPIIARAPIEPAPERTITNTDVDPNDPRYRGSPF